MLATSSYAAEEMGTPIHSQRIPVGSPRHRRVCSLSAAGDGHHECRKPASVLAAARRQAQTRHAGVPAARYPAPPRLLGSTWEPGSVSERLNRGRVQWNLGKFTCGGARLATTDRMQRGGCQPFACTTIRCPREDCKARESASLVTLTRCLSICEA